jgi:hypothetical protein
MARLKKADQHEIGSSGTVVITHGSLKGVNPSIEHHDRHTSATSRSVFLELGGSTAGSRATSEDHSKSFEAAVRPWLTTSLRCSTTWWWVILH